MDETLLGKINKRLHEAVERSESMYKIRTLQPNEQPPMELLLLADPSEKNIAKYLPTSQVYVATEETLVIGVYVLKEIAHGKGEIMNVAVAEAQQGKGIGKALVKHAIEKAKALSMQSVEIGTGNSSIQQLALYQKCGFRLKEILHDYFIDNYDEPIYENDIQCRDMVRLHIQFK